MNCELLFGKNILKVYCIRGQIETLKRFENPRNKKKHESKGRYFLVLAGCIKFITFLFFEILQFYILPNITFIKTNEFYKLLSLH